MAVLVELCSCAAPYLLCSSTFTAIPAFSSYSYRSGHIYFRHQQTAVVPCATRLATETLTAKSRADELEISVHGSDGIVSESR